MAAIQWIEEEDITMCESWVKTLTHYTPRDRLGLFWGHIFQQVCIHRGDTTRAVDALSSCFRTIHLDSLRFETVHNAVQNDGGNLSEDDIMQVALVNYKH
ncbi:hypothetical protein Hanom_Chr11g00998321 [Helianthus anomalus]